MKRQISMVNKVVGEYFNLIDFEESVNNEIAMIENNGCVVFDIKYQILKIENSGEIHYAMIIYGYGGSI